MLIVYKNTIAIHSHKKKLDNPGIDPGTSHMLSERSTIWANRPPLLTLASVAPYRNPKPVDRLMHVR